MKKKVITPVGVTEPTGHLNTSEIGYIKIPTDFHSLHDLKELVNNYDLVSRLTNALNNYNKHYLDSYLMTMDEVLKFIPEVQYKDYRLSCRNSFNSLNTEYAYKAYSQEIKEWQKIPIKNGKKDDYEMKHVVKGVKHYPATKLAYLLPKNKKDGQVTMPLEIALPHMFDYKLQQECGYDDPSNNKRLTKKDRCFLVDTINKVVEVCSWAVYKNQHSSVIYIKDKIEFEVAGKVLTVKVYYNYSNYQQIGGAKIMCGTGYSYYRGGNQVEYDRKGCDLYNFCTRTNKFLGYQGYKTFKDSRPAFVKADRY